MQVPGHGDHQQMGDIRREHEDTETRQPAFLAQGPGAIAGRQRIGEIATRPGEGLHIGFQRDHLVQIGVGQRLRRRRDGPARLGLPPSPRMRSAVVKATLSYIERRGQLGRHRLPAQPVLPRQPGHAGGFRTQDVDPLPGRRRRHVGRVGVPGITGDQQRRAQAPARLMMLRPGHDFGGGDQHGLLERLPGSRLVAFRSCPPVDGQIDFIHAGVQRHQHGLARRGSGLRGHRQMRNHRQHRDIQSQGHALGHAAGHPQAGEPARPWPNATACSAPGPVPPRPAVRRPWAAAARRAPGILRAHGR